MLTAYLTRTRQLLQNPAATVALYADADLTAYINTARSELAGETECVRDYSTLAMAAGTPMAAAMITCSIVPMMAWKTPTVPRAFAAPGWKFF